MALQTSPDQEEFQIARVNARVRCLCVSQQKLPSRRRRIRPLANLRKEQPVLVPQAAYTAPAVHPFYQESHEFLFFSVITDDSLFRIHCFTYRPVAFLLLITLLLRV